MKKLLSILLVLALLASLFPAALAEEIVIVGEALPTAGEAVPVPVDQDHFPDEGFRAYVAEKLDDGDGTLTVAEQRAVEEIEVQGTGIASLVGIEYFTELRTLNFWSDWEIGPLAALDVSHNTKLEHLSVGFCELAALDVTMLPKLKSLFIGFTRISNLDLTQNHELEQLICNDCGLSELDLSGNPKLDRLDCCGNTELYSLDIKDCPALVEMYRTGGRHISWMEEVAPDLYWSILVYGGTNDEDYCLAVNTYTTIFDEPGIAIKVWVSESTADLTRAQIRAFNAKQLLSQPINARVEPVSESDIYYLTATDPESAADIFGFPQDQLANLVGLDALDPLGAEAAAQVREENSAGVVKAASYHGGLFAYPMTADNGYFMYYDKRVIPEADLDSLEALIADCEAAGKTFAFEATSGWYLISFFFGTGCVSEWESDGNDRSWRYTDTINSEAGLIAAKGFKKLAASPAFVDSSNGGSFASRNSAVVVSGTWDAVSVAELLGDNFGATDLPSFTVDGNSYHMGSFSGCKLLGVKPQEDMPRTYALHLLAQYLTSEEAQLERFEWAGWGPSNLAAQADPAVQANPALAALLKQSEFATPQGVFPGFWWDKATRLGVDLIEAADEDDMRQALENYRKSLPAQTLPVPPLFLDGMSTAGVQLGWPAMDNAVSYELQRKAGGDWETILSGEPFGYVDAAVLMGQTYVYRVRATNGSDWSDWSGELEVFFNPFADVSGTKTIEYVAWAFNNGIVNGTGSTKFSPDNPCTRIQFVMMLWKMHGSPEVGGTNPFSDISGSKTTKAILWALNAGVINSGKKFNPDGNISRIQIVMMLWKLAGSPDVGGKNPFTDVSGSKTTKAVLWAYQNGITKGTSSTKFSPDKDCTRVQLVVFLYKYNGIYHVI